jgi:dihydroxyacetone kinase
MLSSEYSMPNGAERIWTELDSGVGRTGERGVVAIKLENLSGLDWLIAKLFSPKVEYKGKIYCVDKVGPSFRKFIARNSLQGTPLSEISQLATSVVQKDLEKKKIETKLEKLTGDIIDQERNMIRISVDEFCLILSQLGLTRKEIHSALKQQLPQLEREANINFSKKNFAKILVNCIGGKKDKYTGELKEVVLAIEEFAHHDITEKAKAYIVSKRISKLISEQ